MYLTFYTAEYECGRLMYRVHRKNYVIRRIPAAGVTIYDEGNPVWRSAPHDFISGSGHTVRGHNTPARIPVCHGRQRCRDRGGANTDAGDPAFVIVMSSRLPTPGGRPQSILAGGSETPLRRVAPLPDPAVPSLRTAGGVPPSRAGRTVATPEPHMCGSGVRRQSQSATRARSDRIPGWEPGAKLATHCSAG